MLAREFNQFSMRKSIYMPLYIFLFFSSETQLKYTTSRNFFISEFSFFFKPKQLKKRGGGGGTPFEITISRILKKGIRSTEPHYSTWTMGGLAVIKITAGGIIIVKSPFTVYKHLPPRKLIGFYTAKIAIVVICWVRGDRGCSASSPVID